MFENILDNTKKREVTTEYNRVINEFKQTQIFPKGNIPTDFLATVKECLRFASPTQLQMLTADYKAVKSNHDLNFTYLDMGTILYVFQQRTQAELGYSDKQYYDFLDLTDVISLEWKTLLENEALRVAAEMEATALKELKELEDKMNAGKEDGSEETTGKNIPLGIAAEAEAI